MSAGSRFWRPGLDVVGAGVIVLASGPAPRRRALNGLSDIRAFFHNNTVPLYFISPTPFNLLGIDRWVRNFFYLNYFDSSKARIRACSCPGDATASIRLHGGCLQPPAG